MIPQDNRTEVSRDEFQPKCHDEKQFEKMISQRFGSVDNMMNDMSKFAGNNPTLKNALDLYKKVMQTSYIKYNKMCLMKNIYHQMELYRNSLDYNISP